MNTDGFGLAGSAEVKQRRTVTRVYANGLGVESSESRVDRAQQPVGVPDHQISVVGMTRTAPPDRLAMSLYRPPLHGRKGACTKTAVALLLSVFGFLAVNPAVAGDAAPAMPQTTRYKIDNRAGGQLFTTTAKLQVLSAPKAGSKVLQEYDKGAIMAVIGEATGTGYLYVSPCNACENGFVSKTELQAKARR